MQRIYPFILIILIGATAFGVAHFRNVRLENPRALRFGGSSIIIHQDTNMDGLVAELQSQEAFFEEEEFRWAAKLSGWKQFKEGHYRFEDATTYEQLLEKIGRGLQDPVRFTLRKGQTPGRLAAQMGWAFKADSASFSKVLQDTSLFSEPSIELPAFFSKMLPETYEFYWDTEPKRVVERIQQTFDRKTRELFESIPPEERAMSLEEAIIMASIVEWEAAKDDEKPRIAGLYYNRLKRGMRLQADPTVNYAIGERRRLFYEDYRVRHPFNTYRIKGLPPAPINNPALSSIKAALQPEEHDYLYMVAEPGATGYHVFTKTYAAHKRESRKWTQWLREQYRIREQREQQAVIE